jgi:hypothetical protein
MEEQQIGVNTYE